MSNYVCNKDTICSFLLTGPQWKLSYQLSVILDLFLSPRVINPRREILSMMSNWGILINIKKVNGFDWIYPYVNLCSKFQGTY